MNELYFNEAVVLDKEDSNDADSRFSIYAKGYGKIYAKAKSARKILSKLSGHLEPGSLVKIRLVGNGAWQVVDTLKIRKVLVNPPDLYMLNQLLPEADFDFGIWEILVSSPSTGSGSSDPSALRQLADHSGRESLDWKKALKVLGWDPEHAVCEICKKNLPTRFEVGHQVFSCETCFLRRRETSLRLQQIEL